MRKNRQCVTNYANRENRDRERVAAIVRIAPKELRYNLVAILCRRDIRGSSESWTATCSYLGVPLYYELFSKHP